MNPTTLRPVAHGTAEMLARICHFRALEDVLPEAHELDPVIRFLVGPVDDAHEVVAELLDDLDQLWSILTEDYDADSDLDELTEADWARHSFSSQEQETEHRLSATISRLAYSIEAAIYLARLIHAEHGRGVAA